MKHPAPAGHRYRWDGSRYGTPTQRLLRLAPDTRTRALRAPQSKPCRACGNRVEWFPRPAGPAVPLHPHELPADQVPERLRWHVADGIAYPIHDGSEWCRIRHAAVCPRHEHAGSGNRLGRLLTLQRELALHSRKLIDHGLFRPEPEQEGLTVGADPRRDVVHLFLLLYLAPGPLEEVRCIAQTRQRTRCPRLLLDSTEIAPWASVAVPPAPHDDHLTGDLTGTSMVVRDLTHLPANEQMRWRHQHCPSHVAGRAADVVLPQWLPFDAFAHHQHIHPAPPDQQAGTNA